MTEYAAAKGGLVLKPYVSGDGIMVDYVQADMFVPLSFDGSGRITGCVFLDYETAEGGRFTRIETHKFIEPGRNDSGEEASRGLQAVD